MKHPLHTPEVLQHIPKDMPYRHSGRSTAQAFELIAKAMRNPYIWYRISDHYGSNDADINLRYIIEHMLNTLGFEHFYFSCKRNAIAFGLPKREPDF